MSARDTMQMTIGLADHHVAMIETIVRGVPITAERPGNVAFGAALRCAARVAGEAEKGAAMVEFVYRDGRRETVPLEALWR